MRVIVSLTSWAKRINTVIKTIDSILNQTVKPDLVELNLSIEEFPNRESDLPSDLREYVNKGIIEINWVEGNTRTFKKIIPTLQKFYGEAYWLLSIDDDFIYRNDYVEAMIICIRHFAADSFCCSNSIIIGNRTIYNSLAFESDFWEKLTPEVIQYGIDDSYIEYYLMSKGKKLSHFRLKNTLEMIKSHDENSPLHDEYRVNNRINKALEEIKKLKF